MARARKKPEREVLFFFFFFSSPSSSLFFLMNSHTTKSSNSEWVSAALSIYLSNRDKHEVARESFHLSQSARTISTGSPARNAATDASISSEIRVSPGHGPQYTAHYRVQSTQSIDTAHK